MSRVAAQLGGKFDAAHQLEARRLRRVERQVVARQRIVVGNRQYGHAAADRIFDQCRRRQTAVGFIRVRVQIDQNRLDPDVPV